MIEIPLKPLNDQNSVETSKKTKKIPWNLKNDQCIHQNQKKKKNHEASKMTKIS